MNKIALSAIALSLVAGTATADIINYSGMNDQGSWDRPIGVGPSISSLGPVMFHAETFTITSGGLHDISSVQGYDGYLHLYLGSFDPMDQLTNLIAGNDDGVGGIGTSDIMGINLLSGTTYVLVTSAFQDGDEGSFQNSIVPAPASAALLAFGGLVATRRRR